MSFSVKWNSEKASTGKVYAKAKKQPPVGSQHSQDSLKVDTNKSKNVNSKQSLQRSHKSQEQSKDKDKLGEERRFTPRTFNDNFTDAPKLVKRKQKKDKIAAKALTALGQTNTLMSNKHPQNQTHSLFSIGHKDIHINTNLKGKSLIEKVFSAEKKFSDLNIHKYLVSNLEKNNFKSLTNVQEKSIPVVLSGKNVLIRSQTGSGKTLAYAAPILDALQGLSTKLRRNDGCQAIIIVPTRELALQTVELFGKINTFQWIVVGYLCGGENRNSEKTRLRKGVHILIATPGRLLDHILHTTAFKLNTVRCLVLDEADRLLDMGFKKDIVKIVESIDDAKVSSTYDPMALLKGKQTECSPDIKKENFKNTDSPLRNIESKNRQTILLSATLNKGIAELATFTMKEHVYIDALDEHETVNSEFLIIPDTVKQEFILSHPKHKLFTLSAMLIAKSKTNSKTFVFMATSQMVDYHHELFTRFLLKMPVNRGKSKSGNVLVSNDMMEDSDDDEEIVLNMNIYKLHGSMDQSARKDVFTQFKAVKKGILLCTDVAARGIDVPEADCIIQYTGPQSFEDYIHRVGRTGRAGKSGTSIIFLTHEEQDFVSKLQEHKIFLQKREPDDFLKHLSLLMEQPLDQEAASALQRRFENELANDKALHKKACFAYSSWSRFYNTYPNKMRDIFDFKNVNLGHYVTSFGLKETPTQVARAVKGQIANVEKPRLNRKLQTHEEDAAPRRPAEKRKIKSVSLTTSEYSSGLPNKKKKKKNTQ